MIFSYCKSEIYYLLSILLKSYDIDIIKDIYKRKQEIENKETVKWYINEGKKYKKYKEGTLINLILFNPYHEYNKSLHINHKKVFHLKILFETFLYKGFILNYENNEYSIPLLSEKIQTLNDFIKDHGIYEIYGKTFQYKSFKLTDLVGNPCVRSIIRKKVNDTIIYEYKTMAISGDQFIDPVDRLTTGIH